MKFEYVRLSFTQVLVTQLTHKVLQEKVGVLVPTTYLNSSTFDFNLNAKKSVWHLSMFSPLAHPCTHTQSI